MAAIVNSSPLGEKTSSLDDRKGLTYDTISPNESTPSNFEDNPPI